jgi:hypothetical protein
VSFALFVMHETTLKKFPRVMKETARFVGKVMFKLEFYFNFSSLHIHHIVLNLKI